jgi:beta-lactamase regulating signal transducer with metallopeptidase domain
MMGSLDFATILAERVLNSIPEGLLIAGFAWLLLRLVARQNSGTRFAVWFSALLAIVAVPFVPAIPVAGVLARAAHARVTLPSSWALTIVGVWGMVALLAFARLIHGLWRVSSLRKQAEPVDLSELDPVLRQTIEGCQAIRPFGIRSSAEIRVPTAIGFFKPVILIPDWALEELPAEELRVVILHEFAHLQRWDDWTNLAQKIVRGVFFFHPAVLWIERRISLEREMACDDVVLAETQDAHLYARCLVSLAEKSFVRRTLAVAQSAIGRAHETTLRLAQILDVDRPKATRVFKPILAAVTAFVAVCIFAVPEAPRLISFEDSAPTENLAAVSDIQASPLPKAMVVPATAHLDRAEPLLIRTNSVETPKRQSAATPRVTLAKRRESAKHPLVVQASAKERMPAPQYLVITQSTGYYREGSAVVSVSVWKMTLLTVRQPRPQINKLPNQT